MKLLAIIPARANSKGVLNKNRQLLAGKPLVLHAIDIAIQSAIFDKIILSSDDDTILQLARSRDKIDIPFKRPDVLSADDSLIADVIQHLLEWLWEKMQYRPDAFMLLEPTSPLRTVADIRLALQQFKASEKDCLIAVSAPTQHPSNMICETKGNLSYCLPRKQVSNGRQDFPAAWFINGALYLTKTDFFLRTKKIYDLTCCDLYKIPAERAFDINTEFDLALVRAYVNQTALKVYEEREIYG